MRLPYLCGILLFPSRSSNPGFKHNSQLCEAAAVGQSVTGWIALRQSRRIRSTRSADVLLRLSRLDKLTRRSDRDCVSERELEAGDAARDDHQSQARYQSRETRSQAGESAGVPEAEVAVGDALDVEALRIVELRGVVVGRDDPGADPGARREIVPAQCHRGADGAVGRPDRGQVAQGLLNRAVDGCWYTAQTLEEVGLQAQQEE